MVDGGLWLHNNTARKIAEHGKEVPFSVAFNESDNDKENGSLLGFGIFSVALTMRMVFRRFSTLKK